MMRTSGWRREKEQARAPERSTERLNINEKKAEMRGG